MRRDVDIPLMALAGGRELPQLDQGDLVIEVLDPEQAVVHAEVAAAGFHAPVEAFLGLMTPAVLRRSGVRTYVGKIEGEPVATGVGVCLANHIGIFNVATLPAYRRHGYGAAITGRAVRDGLDRGARWAWLQATRDGYRIYEKLGFGTLESWECWIALDREPRGHRDRSGVSARHSRPPRARRRGPHAGSSPHRPGRTPPRPPPSSTEPQPTAAPACEPSPPARPDTRPASPSRTSRSWPPATSTAGLAGLAKSVITNRHQMVHCHQTVQDNPQATGSCIPRRGRDGVPACATELIASA